MGMVEERAVHRSGGESRTKQSDALSSDVNAIMKRYVAHGVLPPSSGRRPRYGDFTSATSYHEAMDRMLAAQEEFHRLPAAVRDACRNDLGVFVEACSTDEGRAQLRELGLDPAFEPEAVVPEPVAAPEPEAKAEGVKAKGAAKPEVPKG